jgi:UDPglucose 6-dehydrogenase
MPMILGDGQLANAIRENVGDVDWTWIAYDAEYGRAEQVLQLARPFLEELPVDAHVVISSQVPVGTCARFEAEFPGLCFCVVPENIRVASGVEDFKSQDRIVVGARDVPKVGPVVRVLEQFTEQILFMSPESAEMSKSALNGFLALSIAYANEIARLCEEHGADPDKVALALMTDGRIGARAYLKPGPLPNENLLREVANLTDLGGGPLIQAIR